MWLRNKKTGGLFNTDDIGRKDVFNEKEIANLKDKTDFVTYGAEEAYKALYDFKRARAKAERERKLVKAYKDRLKYNNDPWGNPLTEEGRKGYQKSLEEAVKLQENSKRDKKFKEQVWKDEVRKYKQSTYGQIDILDKRKY